MPHRYAVMGAGMQGGAAAYDLALFGDASAVVLADVDQARLERAVVRLNGLLGPGKVTSRVVDARDEAAMETFLRDFDVAVGALPYTMHPALARAGLRAACSVVDMGLDTDELMVLLRCDKEAQDSGVAIVMDCGLAPGLVNCLAAELMESLDTPRAVRLYCGGLPADPKPPLGYALRFSAEGLIGEYTDDAFALRNGKIERLDPLTEVEPIEFPGIGSLEAAVTSGGSGAAPSLLEGRPLSYDYKTLRYPGHWSAMKLFRDVGLWSEEPVPIGFGDVAPREAFCRVLERELRDEGEDIVLTRVEADGLDQGKAVTKRIEFIGHADPVTGFTAMERLTAFSTTVVAIAVANGGVRRGVLPCFEAVSGSMLRQVLRERGVSIPAAVTLPPQAP